MKSIEAQQKSFDIFKKFKYTIFEENRGLMGFGYHKKKLNQDEFDASRKIQSLGMFWGASMLEMHSSNKSMGINQLYI